jgi:hypothetical protein
MHGGMDSFFAAHNNHVLFNFIDATSLTFSGIGMEGSVLAPDAEINGQSGVIWGQVIGASWFGNMQINQVYYDGYMPALGNPRDNVAAPVLATVALLLPASRSSPGAAAHKCLERPHSGTDDPPSPCVSATHASARSSGN